ncbi:MAG TPA: hypothetical protein VFF27_05510 [Bacteroidia bacterium]|jgi:hypothetical protein|nr:hypothetical protein [Bacteroidia bacterium]
MNVLDVIKMDIKSYRLVTCFAEPEDDILFFNCQQNLEIDLPLAEELVANRLEFTKYKKHYMIQQIPPYIEINFEALQYLKDPERGLKNLKGVAYLVSNNSSVRIADDLIKGGQRKIPSQVFTSEKEALQWIKNLKEYHLITQS